MDDTVASIYRQEGRRIFSTLVRLLGSFDLAEDALHDAFAAALKRWPAQGVPTRRPARRSGDALPGGGSVGAPGARAPLPLASAGRGAAVETQISRGEVSNTVAAVRLPMSAPADLHPLHRKPT